MAAPATRVMFLGLDGGTMARVRDVLETRVTQTGRHATRSTATTAGMKRPIKNSNLRRDRMTECITVERRSMTADDVAV